MNVLDPLNDELKKNQQHQFRCYMTNKLRSLDVKMDLLMQYQYLIVLNLLYTNIVRRSNHQFQIRTLSSIIIPHRLTRTLMDQSFLFCHNHLSPVLGFASPMAVQLLGANEHWNSDGTFRIAPKLFYQSYSIHVWDDFSMKSVIYAALPNKKLIHMIYF